jgi:hypothetical protein
MQYLPNMGIYQFSMSLFLGEQVFLLPTDEHILTTDCQLVRQTTCKEKSKAGAL